jgi:hypothetical protein
MAAAHEPIARDGTDVDPLEVEGALDRWMVTIAPAYDFRYASVQQRISGEIEGLGPVDGHPDVVLGDGRIFDVKTSKRPKKEQATVELAFYALIGRECAGLAVPSVGYWTYVRTQRPYWQTVEFTVTDALIDWAVEKGAAYVRAKNSDERLNRGQAVPVNWSMSAGPKYGCSTCQYADICRIREGSNDDAA